MKRFDPAAAAEPALPGRWRRPLEGEAPQALRGWVSSQVEDPGFSDQIVPETVVRLARDQPIAGCRVDAARGQQVAVGPQRDAAIAGVAREALAFFDQPA